MVDSNWANTDLNASSAKDQTMTISEEGISNPFRPGAGHMPPYLAGRQAEQQEFIKLLRQKPILKNILIILVMNINTLSLGGKILTQLSYTIKVHIIVI